LLAAAAAVHMVETTETTVAALATAVQMVAVLVHINK
jgi:hypothetical protein